MDFGELLHYAKKHNDASTKDGNKYYSTKYAPPKKESKESKQLSDNIQKFLKKREAEEQERKRVERQKLADLLALRDEKSKNKIRKMLKVTKSANKSVLDDAKDGGHAVAADGNEQGEGDDYGYVSTEANALYQKYIEKVKDVQEDKGFAPIRPQTLRDLSGTKERVKAAITRERDEAMSHTRQRSSTTSTTTTTSSSAPKKECNVARAYSTAKTVYDPGAERREAEQKKPKVKRAQQAPPMDFQALLRLAEKKQHEPVVFATTEKKKEPERLLSAREKREHEERQRQREERARRERDRARGIEPKAKEPRKEAASSSNAGNRMEANGRIPKLSNATATKPQATATTKDTATSNESKSKQTSDSLKRTGAAAGKIASSAKPIATSSSSKAAALPATKAATSSSAGSAKPSANGSTKPSRNPYAMANKNGATREFPPRDVPAAKTRLDAQRAPSRQLPQPDVRARGTATGHNRRPAEPAKKQRIYDDDDDDEDYDSELDDFIDDGDCEEDISSHIRDIFGYDKRKYRNIDDDDRGMESSFAQMQREEFISKKLGLQEDLEDMRMEAMHKKRKIAKKRSRGLDDED